MHIIKSIKTYPVDERSLGVEQVKLVIETGPSGGDGSGVGKHTERSRDLGKIAARDERRRLIADTNLETGRTPVNKLDSPLSSDVGDSSVDVLGDNIASVKHTARHILALSGIALNHLVVGLETRHGHLVDRVRLVEGLFSRDDGRIGGEREVDTRVTNGIISMPTDICMK